MPLGKDTANLPNHTTCATRVLYFSTFFNYLLSFSIVLGKHYSCSCEYSDSGIVSFNCTFKNQVVHLMCSFDGGEPEGCAFPLELSAFIYGLAPHTVEVTAYGIFGLNITIPFTFQITDREFSLHS